MWKAMRLIKAILCAALTMFALWLLFVFIGGLIMNFGLLAVVGTVFGVGIAMLLTTFFYTVFENKKEGYERQGKGKSRT